MCTWNRDVILQDLVLALVINTSATLLAGAPLEWGTWFPYTAVAFFTNVLAQLVIPTGSIAAAATRDLEGRPARLWCSVFIENLIFVTIISLTEAFTQVGVERMIPTWWSTYVWLMLIGYGTSMVLVWAFSRKRA